MDDNPKFGVATKQVYIRVICDLKELLSKERNTLLYLNYYSKSMHVGKHIVFCIVTMVIALPCLSQNEKTDSLNHILTGLKDSVKIDCLNTLSEAYRDIQTDIAFMGVGITSG
jgi:hypothetical protein